MNLVGVRGPGGGWLNSHEKMDDTEIERNSPLHPNQCCEQLVPPTTKTNNRVLVSKNNGWENPHKSSILMVFSKLFSPSILGYLYFWKHLCCNEI